MTRAVLFDIDGDEPRYGDSVNEFTITSASGQFQTHSFTFPGGELQLQVPGLPARTTDELTVIARLQSVDALIKLSLLDEILDRVHDGKRKLVIPYFPYARQDRVMAAHEAFSLKPIARLVNSLGYDQVVICDPHSDVAPALVERVKVIPQVELVAAHGPLRQRLQIEQTLLVVAPDAGATKKAFSIAHRFTQPLVTASKIRDTQTGAISRTEVPPSPWLINQDALIVDDICDGGRTFIELAKVLRAQGAARVYLYVTHGIFSQGLGVFDGLIDAVYTTNSFLSRDVESPHQSPVPLHVSPIERFCL